MTFTAFDDGKRGVKTLKLQLHKCTVDLDAEEEKEDEALKLDPYSPLACVLDAGFLFRGFRGRAKKDPSFFRLLCRTLDQFVDATQTTVNLGYDVQSLIATRKLFPGTPVYVYCCFNRQTLPLPTIEQVLKSEETNTIRDSALETWLELEKELKTRQSELRSQLVVIDSPEARVKAAQEQEEAVTEATDNSEPRKVYVQATGEITRRDTLGWSPKVFTKVMSLLRKGDELVAVGFMARNARGHSMLQVEALSLARTGEFEAYN
eukprot:jgi/Phyca11/6517/fgenesh1_pm.PHYCAscaffold_12_\